LVPVNIWRSKMNTRRNRLIPREQVESGVPPPVRIRNITLRELSEHRVAVPAELRETGMSLIILVGVDGRLQPGLVDSEDVPTPKPIQDLNRLQRARSVVSSLDAASSKMSVVNEVKEQVISAALSHEIDPKKVDLKLGAQAELIKTKTLMSTLVENQELFRFSPQNKSATYRAIATRWFDNTLKTLNEYVLNSLCQNQSIDLNTLLLENHVPKWFFNKFTTNKVPELVTNSIDDIFFPKKLSKMITFSEREIVKKTFITESGNFQLQLIQLLNIVSLYPSKDKVATLFPCPNDFSKRFGNFVDLPQIDRTTNPATILSVTLIHMVFCAIPLKALVVDNIQHHYHSLVYKDKISLYSADLDLKEYLELVTKQEPKHEPFQYIPEMTSSLKVQYKDFVNSDGRQHIVGFRLLNDLCQVFNITPVEQKALGEVLIFDMQPTFDASSIVNPLFRPYPEEIIKHSKRSLYSEAFSVLRPTQPKELNFGLPNSPLNKESEQFLKNLTSAKFNLIFLTNVKKYLQSFNNPLFQTQAVKIMHATLQARTVMLSETPDEITLLDEGSDNPYADFS